MAEAVAVARFLLLSAGVQEKVMPKTTKPSMKETALAFRRALMEDRREAGRLLELHPELIDFPIFGASESALHFFAVENRGDIVRWLLAQGANPKGIAEDDSPLHNAAQLGHLEICRELLEAGADLDTMDSLGETALHKASARGHVAVIELLLAAGADPTIPEMCGQLPVDQALPRKRDEVHAAFARHAKAQEVQG